jgi:hypothetical protein
MGWIIATCTLGLLAMMLTALYRRAFRENRHLTNYALLMLLDEKVYASQRQELIGLVHNTDAKNATELSARIQVATSHTAARLADTSLAAARLLWQIKTIEPTM